MFSKFKNQNLIQKEDMISQDIIQFFVEKTNIKKTLEYLKNTPDYLMERLDCIYAKDTNQNFEITYLLHSDNYNFKCAISCIIEYSDANIDSIVNLYKSANYDEREIFDLFGINFRNHPNLKRILLPESFIGHPLKKDYTMNDERLKWNYESSQ